MADHSGKSQLTIWLRRRIKAPSSRGIAIQPMGKWRGQNRCPTLRSSPLHLDRRQGQDRRHQIGDALLDAERTGRQAETVLGGQCRGHGDGACQQQQGWIETGRRHGLKTTVVSTTYTTASTVAHRTVIAVAQYVKGPSSMRSGRSRAVRKALPGLSAVNSRAFWLFRLQASRPAQSSNGRRPLPPAFRRRPRSPP